jgi:hypothetical protein
LKYVMNLECPESMNSVRYPASLSMLRVNLKKGSNLYVFAYFAFPKINHLRAQRSQIWGFSTVSPRVESLLLESSNRKYGSGQFK